MTGNLELLIKSEEDLKKLESENILEDIEKITVINRNINRDKDFLLDYSFLNWKKLKESVKEIEINDGNFPTHKTLRTLDDFTPGFKFFEDYKKLEKISFISGLGSQNYGSPIDFTRLATPNLEKNLKILELKYTNFSQISLLKNYQNLECLNLSGSEEINNFKDLASSNLEKTIKKLHLNSTKIRDLNVLKNYKVLEELDLSDSFIGPDRENHTINYEALKTPNLEKSIKILNLISSKFSDLSILENYQKLEDLDIGMCDIIDFSHLKNDNFENNLIFLNLRLTDFNDIDLIKDYKNLEYLDLSNIKTKQNKLIKVLKGENFSEKLCTLYLNHIEIESIDFLQNYKNLEDLVISSNKISNFDVLNRKNLAETVERFEFNCKNFSDLSLLKNYSKLNKLSVQSSSIISISDLLDYEFIKNSSLKEIHLPDTINWTEIKDGKFVNTEVVRELKRRGVYVHTEGFDLEDDLIKPKPKVYVLLGPSAAGKSTTIDKLISDLGYSKLDKITNRPPRETDSDYVRLLTKQELEFLDKEKQLVGKHIYHENFYAYDLRQLQEAQDNTKTYITDTCDVDAALALREMFPNLIEIIGINPLTDLRGKALENRITTHNNEDLYQEQKNNTKERLKEIRQENQTMQRLKELGTTIIEGQTYEKTFQDIKEIIQAN